MADFGARGSRMDGGNDPAEARRHSEGSVARGIEEHTARIPSDLFLWSALGAIAVSAGLQLAQRPKLSLFIGQWVAPFLLLGVYNKIVKVGGSDRTQYT